MNDDETPTPAEPAGEELAETLRRGWRRRLPRHTLPPDELEALRRYDRERDTAAPKKRLPRDFQEKDLTTAARRRGFERSGDYLVHIVRKDALGELVDRSEHEALCADYDRTLDDLTRLLTDTNRRLAEALAERHRATSELEEALRQFEAAANRLDELLDIVGAPAAGEVDLSFLVPELSASAAAPPDERPAGVRRARRRRRPSDASGGQEKGPSVREGSRDGGD